MFMSNLKREICSLIIQQHFPIFLKKKNVVGLAFGNKTTNGVITDESCLSIFVTKKQSPSELNPNDLIPKTYNGAITDVVETGELHHTSLTEKVLPMQFGYSIGPSNFKGVGSSGCLVIDRCGNYYILANNHVLSVFDTLPIGTPVLYPGIFDGGKYPNDLIGTLCKKIPLLTSVDGEEFINYVDCALVKIANPSMVSKKIALIGCVKGVCDAELNLNVKKVGRTSELTTGKIIQLDALLKVQNLNGEDILYHNQIVTTLMTEAGDSGSLLLDENNNAVGLCFGNSETISMVNPIKSVLTALNVSIVTCS